MTKASTQQLARVIKHMLGDCIDHPHFEKLGAVWCAECDRRLYEGMLMGEKERARTRALLMEASDDD